VEVVSEERSPDAPARSGAPQLEQNRLASAFRFPHRVQTGKAVNPPPVLEVDRSSKPMRPDAAGSTEDAP
jgi:hypothetical protein